MSSQDGGRQFETMELAVDDRVAWLRFTRPDRLNSLSEAVLGDLDEALDQVAADTGVRALVLTGSGKAFSVGLDMGLLDRAFAEPEYFDSVLTRLGRLCLKLESLPVPTIAAVNGLARAGGFEMMLACDLVVLAEEARIGDVHTVHGVIPAGGSTVRLPRVVGAQRAREIFMTGRWIDPAEAVALGLAVRAVPGERLDAAAAELAASLTDKSRDCLGALKRQLVAVDGLALPEALEAERREFLAYVAPAGSDAQEGYRASKERRSPAWG
jgi:enoyl-CoA hydratase/carnithine racemase